MCLCKRDVDAKVFARSLSMSVHAGEGGRVYVCETKRVSCTRDGDGQVLANNISVSLYVCE